METTTLTSFSFNEDDRKRTKINSSAFQPFHADASLVPCQKLPLNFQSHWYQQFPWLHFDSEQKCIKCFYCCHVCLDTSLPWIGNADPAFTSAGFYNWKKGLERFRQHEASHIHYLSVNHWSSQTKPIDVLLNTHCQEQQKTAAKCLNIIATSVRYLAHQGLALRGHSGDSGHLQELLKLRTADIPELKSWLERHNSYTSGNIQNELLLLMSQAVQRKLMADVAAVEPMQFSVIVDGIRDISGTEQESICFRFVDKHLTPREIFVGLYAANETTGEALSNMITDVLLRLNLLLSALRGQTYDGASSMAGQYSGCQALIR